jgi:hypothetical protein
MRLYHVFSEREGMSYETTIWADSAEHAERKVEKKERWFHGRIVDVIESQPETYKELCLDSCHLFDYSDIYEKDIF